MSLNNQIGKDKRIISHEFKRAVQRETKRRQRRINKAFCREYEKGEGQSVVRGYAG